MIWTMTQVALGGAIGAALRFLAVSVVGTPVGTLIVNVAGCFAMGVLAVWLLGPKGPGPIAPFLVTGVLGGFTTFSAFSLDTLKLWQAGQTAQAALYVGGSVVLSLVAVALGAALARGVFA
jgi:CrcB protein